MMKNLKLQSIDHRGEKSFESVMHSSYLYRDPGANPTRSYWYGENGSRWNGRGRKRPHRSWKENTKHSKSWEIK